MYILGNREKGRLDMTQEKLMADQKVPLLVKIGYGIGTAGDSVPYNLFFTYFLFFLTDVAGVNPALAGIISFIAVMWDAVTDPAVGFMSDNSRNPNGRRRPWIFTSMWPLAIVTFLLFIPNEFAGVAQSVYYILMAILLWTFYTTYAVPYAALGAEITRDYNERNTIRMIVGLAAYPFVALCNSGPMWIIAALAPKGVDVKTCWGIAGAAAGVVIILCGLILYFATKGREDMTYLQNIEKNKPRESVIKTYKELFKIKAYRNLIFTGIFYIIGYTLFSGVGVYLMTYCAKLTPGQQATFWSVYTVMAICCTPVSIIVANKIGSKKITLFIFSLLFVANGIVMYFLGMTCFTHVMINGFMIALSTSAFWGLYYATVYDVCELDEFINGKQREGSVVAVAQFFQKAGGAFATSATGWMLTAFGYTGSGAESETAIHGILLMATIIPAVFVFISMLIFSKYPINKKEFDAIKEALQKKKAGEEYSTEGFEKAL